METLSKIFQKGSVILELQWLDNQNHTQSKKKCQIKSSHRFSVTAAPEGVRPARPQS